MSFYDFVTLQQLHEIFDTCPMAITVERADGAIYRNNAVAGEEMARWPIEVDGRTATVVSYATSTESERLYQDAPVAMAVIDEGLRYRRVNKKLAAMNGVPVEAHLGRRIAEVLPDLAPFLEPMLQRVLDTGEPVVDLELRGPDWEHGVKERHTLVNFWPYLDAGVRGIQGSVVEITSLKETEERLLGQAKIFEQVHEPVVQTDLEGKILSWNGGAARLFGYGFDEAVGQPISILYFEEDRGGIRTLVIEPLLRNGQHEVILRNRRKDGTPCWIRLSLSLLRDRRGEAYGMVGYSQDITLGREAKLALEASEARYRQLFEASPAGIAVWRADGRLLEANDVFRKMTDRAVAWGTKAVLQGPGEVETFEDEWVREDGSRFPVLVGLAKREAGAEILSYVVDLSRQKSAERAAEDSKNYLELALQGAELGVWDWNIASGHVQFNERWANMLGYECSELEPHYSTWERLIHPSDREHALAVLDAHLKGRTESYHSEHRLLCKSGDWRWIWASGKIIGRSEDGSPLRAAGTHLDISLRKNAELALVQSEKRFHAIFDQTFQLMGLLSPEGTLLEANETALKFGGITREEVINVPFWETYWWTISEETQDGLKRAVEQAASGLFVRYEVDVWDAGKNVTTIDFSLRPIMDAEGRVNVIIAEGRDVTSLKRAQKLVNAEGEKRRLEAVLRSMTKGVVIADPLGNVISMNPAALSLLGLSSEAEGLRAVPQFHEFELRSLDGQLVPLNDRPMARVLRGETFSGYQLEVRRTDTGKHFIGSFGAAPVLDENGQVILVVQTIRDVTRQHEVQHELRQSNLERDFALRAGNMRIWRWQLSEDETPEYSLATTIIGHVAGPTQALELVHPDDRRELRDLVNRIHAGQPFEIEYRLKLEDGSYCWQSSRGQAIASDAGKVFGFTGVTWDITQRKDAESAIAEMNASLHRLSGELLRLQDEERRRLARELHDGPVQILSATAMNLSVLAKSINLSNLAHEHRLAQECLGWVKECSESMRSLSYLLHPPILDELGLTSAVRGWVVGFGDRTGLEVEPHLDEVGRLSADLETALFRILQEALANVHRHSRSSSVRIKLCREDASVVLEVEDSGCGIPAGVLEGRNAGHRLGVGIQGMRERARQLGGQLSIQSTAGGTAVRVVLPEQKVT